MKALKSGADQRNAYSVVADTLHIEVVARQSRPPGY